MAKSVLDRCFFVGVCEKMDESMALIARKMGWPDRPSHRENATSGKRETNDHSPWVINRLKEINALDLDLYQYALGTFAQLKTDPRWDIFHGRMPRALLRNCRFWDRVGTLGNCINRSGFVGPDRKIRPTFP